VRRISSTSRTETRRARYRAGRWSEWIAAALLMAKGYRILGLRAKTPKGEIDLIAVRGRRLAFVEVKRRLTLEDAEASITPRQRERVRQAALLWLARNARYQQHDLGFDLVFIMPRRWPQHLQNALI
jgi:putative endonuclease